MGAVTVLFMGILGGVAIYQSLARSRLNHFHGFCGFPYDSSAINKQELLLSNATYPMRSDDYGFM